MREIPPFFIGLRDEGRDQDFSGRAREEENGFTKHLLLPSWSVLMLAFDTRVIVVGGALHFVAPVAVLEWQGYCFCTESCAPSFVNTHDAEREKKRSFHFAEEGEIKKASEIGVVTFLGCRERDASTAKPLIYT